MVTEFDLGEALFLTYSGVGAAFLVLGSLVVFTGLIGWWGSWRLRRAQARELTETIYEVSATPKYEPAWAPSAGEPQLAAAIGLAVSLALEARRLEQAADELERLQDPVSNGNGWREQGRIAALEGRRLRDRER